MNLELLQLFLAGFLGGFIRGLIGYLKYKFSFRTVKFKLKYLLANSTLSGLIGISVVWAVKGVGFKFSGFFNPSLAFIIGYAGGDFVENIYKIIIKKSSIYLD